MSDASADPVHSSDRAIPKLDRLARLSDEGRLQFAFAVGTMPFHAHLRATADGARMLIAGDVGHLPFTVEAADKRRSLTHVLQHCTQFEWGGISITPSNRIVVHGEVAMQRPINPFAVVRETARFIIKIYPVISLILDETVGQPSA